MDSRVAALDGRAAWIAAGAALAILTVAYGAPLISVVALKTIAAELGTSRAAPGPALAIWPVACGAPLIWVAAPKPIAAERGSSRAARAAAGSFVFIGAGVG